MLVLVPLWMIALTTSLALGLGVLAGALAMIVKDLKQD